MPTHKHHYAYETNKEHDWDYLKCDVPNCNFPYVDNERANFYEDVLEAAQEILAGIIFERKYSNWLIVEARSIATLKELLKDG